MQLGDQVALVTGGARRVGRAIAEELGRAGARVVVHYHGSAKEAEDVARALPGSLALGADLRDPGDCARLVSRAVEGLGRIDLLVNSAAGYLRAPFAEQDEAAWQDLLALNLLAPARLIRLALPHGLKSVVNILDITAWKPRSRHAAYAAAKAGLLKLTRDLALELAPGVRVNGVAPGTVAFPPDFSAADREAVIRRTPLGRIGAPEDVARAVRYLATEEFVTGVVLPVDGGAALR